MKYVNRCNSAGIGAYNSLTPELMQKKFLIFSIAFFVKYTPDILTNRLGNNGTSCIIHLNKSKVHNSLAKHTISWTLTWLYIARSGSLTVLYSSTAKLVVNYCVPWKCYVFAKIYKTSRDPPVSPVFFLTCCFLNSEAIINESFRQTNRKIFLG